MPEPQRRNRVVLLPVMEEKFEYSLGFINTLVAVIQLKSFTHRFHYILLHFYIFK